MSDAPLWAKAVAGGMAGMTVDFVLYPLDTIKTRMQTRPGAEGLPPGSAIARSLRSGAFYRGLASAMAGSFPGAATFWTTYEMVKATAAPLVGTGIAPVVAAASADVAVVAVRNPFEVVKQQMQSGMHANTMSAVRRILSVDGMRGFYAGYGSTVLREIPFDAIEFGLYELMKRKLVQHRRRDLVLWENAALGSVAGGVAAALTTPLDVVKTRLMTQTNTAVADRYTGVVDALRRVYATEGPMALLSGIGPRVLWISVGGAIFIGSYEEFRRRLAPPRAPKVAGERE
ncbi:hypothetical protein FNF27_00312 [Cafeteria roenbergensis]|uniref:Mitochondrial carrier protein n=1 Tax=Cafeteria roenbergensis TaxID=33653 RepID=A0A5A8DF23_CAFRO|nr:hypothetical protein FNF31_02741 [Cafeteria roenbergensis]KAA0171765.1 hypothetical protein FNF28_00401 [Cafeteria roenbergensis]KAA0178463.1 hypothetical protein FNF27_00312 [Cafeteria roenbergensis]